MTNDASRAAGRSASADLLADWTGGYGGVPPFDSIAVDDFEPALEAAMADKLAAIERIASSTEAPTFENTIAALERSGRKFERVRAVYEVIGSSLSSTAYQAVERRMAPRLAAFADRITQNAELFGRIQAVNDPAVRERLTPEQQRLVWLYHTDFVRAGARLDEAAKALLSMLNQRLAEMFTRFNQNLLHDETRYRLVLESEYDLAGLPEYIREAAAAAADEADLRGRWLIANTRSAMEPFLTWSERPDLRERGWRMWVGRGDNADAYDNNAIVGEILDLRARRATLLGYETHAHWRLEHAMAHAPASAMALLEAVWPFAAERAREEIAEMQTLVRAGGGTLPIEPWDHRYYAEKVRQARFDVDRNEIKAYLQLENLRDGMFWVAGELFGYAFRRLHDVPVFHEDVSVWEVTDRASGRHTGLWYFDPYARPGKKSGAWMSVYRSQERFDREVTTIVSNNSNFMKGRAGEPVLLSWDDAETLFHEFGHAMHGLSSSVAYPSLAGTAVPRDYVEFPSQLLEHWLSTPELLQRFAVHHRTREPIPQRLVERIRGAAAFNAGFATTEYLASALIDLRVHLAGEQPIDPAAFERSALAGLGMPREIVMRHRMPHFAHVFGSDGYSAAYYSYLWADVLSCDAFNAFLEADGPFDRSVAERLRRLVLSRGNTIDPADAYRRFRDRDAEIDALLEKLGFAGSS